MHYPPSNLESISEEAALQLVDASDIVSLHDRLLMIPKLHFALKALSVQQAKSVADNTTETLIDVYAEAAGHGRKKMLKGFHWGFGVSYLRPGHPNLTVLGDCACSGITPHGLMFGENDFDNGFGEFDLHNIDLLVQRVALAAGIGSLAYWALKALE